MRGRGWYQKPWQSWSKVWPDDVGRISFGDISACCLAVEPNVFFSPKPFQEFQERRAVKASACKNLYLHTCSVLFSGSMDRQKSQNLTPNRIAEVLHVFFTFKAGRTREYTHDAHRILELSWITLWLFNIAMEHHHFKTTYHFNRYII